MSKAWSYEELTEQTEAEIGYWRGRAENTRDSAELFTFMVAAGAVYSHWLNICDGRIEAGDKKRLAELARVKP